MVWPSPARARWLGALYQAAASGQSLSHYARARRLMDLLVAPSEEHRPSCLVAVVVA